MKILSVLTLVGVLLAAGCATQKRVSELQGRGTTQIYGASFEPVWRAAVDAVQQDGLEVITADRTSGYISARRTVRAHTFGENVGVWIRETAPANTQVEVVSRQVGPPVAWLKNWENEIHRSITANLTREAVGAAPRDVIIDRGGAATVVVPEPSTTVVVPERRETVIISEPATRHESMTEQQRLVEQLRLREDTGQRALANEVDETKREVLQREVTRLREEIKLQEQRLKDLEKQLK
jgi:hypothetical protein